MKSLIPVKQGALSAAQFGKLADVPPELEWLANITNEKPAAPTSSTRVSFRFSRAAKAGRIQNGHAGACDRVAGNARRP
jgi:hypothetical protein